VNHSTQCRLIEKRAWGPNPSGLNEGERERVRDQGREEEWEGEREGGGGIEEREKRGITINS